MNTTNKSTYLVTIFLIAVSLWGCTEVANTVRNVTYPPEFKYVSKEELRSNMQHLAYQLQELEMTLAEAAADPTSQQQRVMNILGEIENITTELSADPGNSNHPFLENHMVDFSNQVGQARIAASLNPPRYYQAGKVAGGCTNCHKVNRN